MSLSAVFLDEGPLSWVVNKPGDNPIHDACQSWALGLMSQGVLVCVAEVTDYELRRELVRQEAKRKSLGQPLRGSVARLDAFIALPGRYVPISTNAMHQAADMWANIRNNMQPTASDKALDGDVILAAQVSIFAATQGIPLSEIIVATTNVKHIDRFIQADLWGNIHP
ncbi:hypothetical protein [Armatimonas sp.]|uniref:hypothetical protein n=1 Tax=Armatimonas sp. TaxID=1872638 RepID=UPI00286B5E56|nr:hypothetical protein [Armatimonas sp.]